MRGPRHFPWLPLLAVVLSVLSAGLSAEGPSAEERLLADGLFARGFYQMALREYQRLLEAYPSFSDRDAVLFRAAESARQHDRPGLARQLYEEILALPVSSDAAVRSRLRLADMAYDQEDYERARHHAAELLRLNPSPDLAAGALHMLAGAVRKLGDTAEARERYQELIRTYPDDPLSAYAALTLARMVSGDAPEEKREWYAAALRNPPSPDLEVEALWGLGMLELDAGHTADAAISFERLWRMHPDHPRVQTGSLTIAWVLMLAERYEDALAVSDATPERRKQDQEDSWLYLEAVSLRDAQRNEQAYASFRRLLDEYPSSRFRSRAAFELARLYAGQSAHRRVMALSEDLLAFPERPEDVLWLLAESARALGRTDDALRWYEELAGRRPVTNRSRDAAFQRALLLRRLDERSAAQALSDFADGFPEDPRAFNSLRAAGNLWSDLGQTNAARRAWRQALEQYPGEPNRTEVKFSLGILELREGDSLAARTLFASLLAHDPDGHRSTLAAYWLAMLSAERGAPDAETLIRQALERNQIPEHERNLRMRLARLLEMTGEVEAAGVEFSKLLEEPGAPGLSDARLRWMLRRARERDVPHDVQRIAERMVDVRRQQTTRELGYYALADVHMSRNNPEAAIAAWRAGLAFGGEHRQAAAAAYALGRALMAANALEEAEEFLQNALRTASGFEEARLQAQSMLALGDLSARREAWDEAARMYMGLAVLFEDPELSPLALRRAASAFQRDGRQIEARKALEELNSRFPDTAEAP